MDHELALQDLALPKERTYFTLVLIISVAVWVLLAVLIIPIFYALIVAVFIWFANGLLVARLRADGVKVDGDQLPKLHAALRDVCARLEIAQVPDLFVIQSGGLLNAFATRHSGRHFVVIYSDLGANVLVTIAVIGILVGLLLPAVEAARSAARRAACAANLLLIEQAKQQGPWRSSSGRPAFRSDDIVFHSRRAAFAACPEGGAYRIGPIGESPACSVHGCREDVLQGTQAPGTTPRKELMPRSSGMTSIN